MSKAASTTRNPRTKSLKRRSGRSSARSSDIQSIPLDQIHPSPENDQLYQPVVSNDPEVQALADSIREYGVREPLVITRDGFILSGHRRFVAARVAGLDSVPCRVEPFNRTDDADQFLLLLREYNRQRVKTLAEQLREEVVSMNPEAAHIELLRHRIQKSDLSGFADGAAIDPGDRRSRCGISNAKLPMLQAALDVLEDRKDFWPLSDRSIHYALLNSPPLRHASKPQSTYANDRASYQDLTDLLTRARLSGLVPWSAIGDETRPVVLWQADSTVQSFVRRELDGFLGNYWRDYQQSQSNHIEIVGEKLSVRQIIEPIAQEFCLPLTIGRGYCSIMPRREMAERFRRSGREQLVIIMLTDFDPDGECIAESFVRSMRDDFSIGEVVAIKAALTREQVEHFQLPPQMKAKAGSASYAAFTEKHGDDVYELEALAPVDLQEAMRASIRSVLDIEAFEHELMQEQVDAAFLEGARRKAKSALSLLLDETRGNNR